jgi:hypothetical protein
MVATIAKDVWRCTETFVREREQATETVMIGERVIFFFFLRFSSNLLHPTTDVPEHHKDQASAPACPTPVPDPSLPTPPHSREDLHIGRETQCEFQVSGSTA